MVRNLQVWRMDLQINRHAAWLLHLQGGRCDRRLLVMAETAFDGHVVLSRGSWLYGAGDAQSAGDWRFEHLASGGLTPALRRRIEAALHSVPRAAPVAQLSPVAACDGVDGEWLSQSLWNAFRRPSIVWLNVPYEAREQAKRAGARWNAQARRWYGVRSQDFDQGLRGWAAGARRH